MAILNISLMTPLLLLAIYGLTKYFSKSKKQEKDGINWTPTTTVTVTLAIYFGAQIIGAGLIYLLPSLFGVQESTITHWLDKVILGQFIFVIVIEALTFYFLYWFIKRRQSNLRAIGLKRPKWRDLGYVLIGFAIYFISYFFVLAIVRQIAPHLDTNQKQVIGFDGASHWQLPLVFISLVILPPLVEETLVRGFLYSGLKKRVPIIWAAIITSVMFAAAHLQAGNGEPLLWTAAIDTLILSFVLIYLREKTGGLSASIGLHMLKNLIAFVSLFIFHIS